MCRLSTAVKIVAKRNNDKKPTTTPTSFNTELLHILNVTQAGLSDEERREIDAAISPEVVAAASAAAMPAPTARAEDNAAAIGGADKGGMVDVGRLLDLCGLAPSPPPARGADPREDPRGADCHRDEVAGCSPRVHLNVASESDSPDEGSHGCSSEEEHDGHQEFRRDNPESDAADVGVGTGSGGGGRRKGRATEAPVVEVDESALRRVTHQADLYRRLLVRIVGGHELNTTLQENRSESFTISVPRGCPLVGIRPIKGNRTKCLVAARPFTGTNEWQGIRTRQTPTLM